MKRSGVDDNSACRTYSEKENFTDLDKSIDERPACTAASIILGSSRIQERTSSSKNKLEKHN